jgi:hypothetical protein
MLRELCGVHISVEEKKLSLGELRCATSGFETVFLSLFHTRVTSQETCFLQNRTILAVCLKKCTGDAVTDCASLASETTAAYVNLNIELVEGLGSYERLTNDNFQGLKT